MPVNRNGEAVAQVRESTTSSKMIWVKADAKTGKPIRGIYGYEPITTAEGVDLGAYVYTTESDYYNNRGYYMFSMLKPGNYRLRFTFPGSTPTTRSPPSASARPRRPWSTRRGLPPEIRRTSPPTCP